MIFISLTISSLLSQILRIFFSISGALLAIECIEMWPYEGRGEKGGKEERKTAAILKLARNSQIACSSRLPLSSLSAYLISFNLATSPHSFKCRRGNIEICEPTVPHNKMKRKRKPKRTRTEEMVFRWRRRTMRWTSCRGAKMHSSSSSPR